MNCTICGGKAEKYLAIYVVGSEGINVCHYCEMLIVDFVRGTMNACARCKLAYHKGLRGSVVKGD